MKPHTLLLISLFTISSFAQNKFTGSWFVLRSESHQSDYSDSSKTESISKTDTTSLDALKVNSNYSATTLNYFLRDSFCFIIVLFIMCSTQNSARVVLTTLHQLKI